MGFSNSVSILEKIERSLDKEDLAQFCGLQTFFTKVIVPERILVPDKSTDGFFHRCYLYACRLILAITSMLTLVRVRVVGGCEFAHYQIDIGARDDIRSKPFREAMATVSHVNFYHVGNMGAAIRGIFKKRLPIYFEPLFEVLRPFIGARSSGEHVTAGELRNLITTTDERTNNYIRWWFDNVPAVRRKIEFYSWLIRFLKIRKFIFLDDGRYTNELMVACKEEKVRTVGYMHNRFNKFHVGLKYFCFDTYLVWSPYFRDLICSMTHDYNTERVLVCGHPRICSILEMRTIKRSDPRVLWLGESNINYAEILPYISAIIEKSSAKVIFRGKLGESEDQIQSYFDELGIEVSSSLPYLEQLVKEQIDVVVGTHSTALLESWVVGVPSVMMRCSYDYGLHLKEDNLALYCDNSDDMLKCVAKAVSMSQAEIESYCRRIWGSDPRFKQDVVENAIFSEN